LRIKSSNGRSRTRLRKECEHLRKTIDLKICRHICYLHRWLAARIHKSSIQARVGIRMLVELSLAHRLTASTYEGLNRNRNLGIGTSVIGCPLRISSTNLKRKKKNRRRLFTSKLKRTNKKSKLENKTKMSLLFTSLQQKSSHLSTNSRTRKHQKL
jgi:hypothetical protein